MKVRGTNMSGLEFGDPPYPGTYGTTHTEGVTEDDADYFFQKKGMRVARIPFMWERVQQSLGGALDSAELGHLSTCVERVTSRCAMAIIEPHNFFQYTPIGGTTTYRVGSAEVTQAHFVDLWGRLADTYKTNSKVLFNLMNEPPGEPICTTEYWLESANAAIAEIRAHGAANKIVVPGNGYSGPHSWFADWYGTSNSDAMDGVVDSGNNFCIELHCYFDGDGSGSYPDGDITDVNIGVDRILPVTTWLRSKGLKGIVGEFGTPNTVYCQQAVTKFLNHIEANRDVWIGWQWWSAGPNWPEEYPLRLEPTGGPGASVDRPQMDWLEPYL
jgi:endoglucanase